MNGRIQFETDRLYARKWGLADVESAFLIYSDPEVMNALNSKPESSIATMTTRMEYIIHRNATFPKGMASWPVFEKATGELIGCAMLKPLPAFKGELTEDIEIGWHLRRDRWGMGYATEFGKKLVDIGFNELELEKLHAVVAPSNLPSQNVARRLGMLHVGQSENYYDGELVEVFELERAASKERQ